MSGLVTGTVSPAKSTNMANGGVLQAHNHLLKRSPTSVLHAEPRNAQALRMRHVVFEMQQLQRVVLTAFGLAVDFESIRSVVQVEVLLPSA